MEIALEDISTNHYRDLGELSPWQGCGVGKGKRKALGATVLKLGSKTASTSVTQDVMGLFKRSVCN